ncbi:hypothetical protein CLG96_09425 [Sphingomonas oleivorans]|uniref:UPF0235 protein CLG96_09425 n=2 Tax=Sphingomonas oleivorans TaxID=1735121 RepID=A0A2T5FYV2_9SPHN|nr:hypothetical protein CLG96_09425 [Sphingomonas oleivorans]
MDGGQPFSRDEGGVRLALRLTPRAGRNGLDGVMAGADGRPALHVRLAAPPVDGAANKALIAFLAEALGMRKGDISILSGETARMKLVRLAGDGDRIAARLTAWIASG